MFTVFERRRSISRPRGRSNKYNNIGQPGGYSERKKKKKKNQIRDRIGEG